MRSAVLFDTTFFFLSALTVGAFLGAMFVS